MALFCAAIRKDSVSFLRFPFHSHFQVFSREISPVCRLKRPYSYFSSHFLFLVIFIQLMHMLHVLFLLAVISLFFALFSVVFVSSINASTLSWMLASFFLLFLTHTLCLRHFRNVMHRHEFSCSPVHLLKFFSRPL